MMDEGMDVHPVVVRGNINSFQNTGDDPLNICATYGDKWKATS